MRPRRVSEVDTDIMHRYIPQGYIHDNPWSGLMWCAGGTVGGDVVEGAQGGGAWSDHAAAR